MWSKRMQSLRKRLTAKQAYMRWYRIISNKNYRGIDTTSIRLLLPESFYRYKGGSLYATQFYGSYKRLAKK